MKGTEVVGVSVFLSQICKPFFFAPVDVSLNRGLASVDQPGVPSTESSQGEEATRTDEGLVEYQRLPGEHSNVLSRIFPTHSFSSLLPPPVLMELFIEDLESKRHDEGAAHDHEDHVEEEMPVVVVSDTVV